jgi:hypothetical protein
MLELQMGGKAINHAKINKIAVMERKLREMKESLTSDEVKDVKATKQPKDVVKISTKAVPLPRTKASKKARSMTDVVVKNDMPVKVVKASKPARKTAARNRKRVKRHFKLVLKKAVKEAMAAKAAKAALARARKRKRYGGIVMFYARAAEMFVKNRSVRMG